MSGGVVNLRLARKRKRRDDDAAAAAVNRAAHGRSKAERRSTEQETARTARVLDGHVRENGEGGHRS